jgi:hypothetical protein
MSNKNQHELTSNNAPKPNRERRQFVKYLAASPLIAGPCAMAQAQQSSLPPYQAEAKDLHTQFDALAKKSSANIQRIEAFTITPNNLPWTQKLGTIKAGQQATFFLTGIWWFSKEHNRWLEPGFVFFARVAGKSHASPIYNTMQNTGTLSADRDGRLEIARAVGEFASPAGDLWVPEEHYLTGQGQITGIAIIWNESAPSGLSKLFAAGDVNNLLKLEIQRQETEKLMPEGWNNYFAFGDGSIYTSSPKGHIQCCAQKNVGIIQYPVANQHLESGLKLNWRWVVEKLPSMLGEDQLLNHDYLSIAVEFDDGKDLTYMWSSQLPVGKVFACPIPGWNAVETHVVQRSGIEQLGKALDEERDIYSDYKSIINGPATRVVNVWLIATTIFMRGQGRCSYREISIGKRGHQQKIL